MGIKEPPEETWTDPETGDTCHDLKINGNRRVVCLEEACPHLG